LTARHAKLTFAECTEDWNVEVNFGREPEE